MRVGAKRRHVTGFASVTPEFKITYSKRPMPDRPER
jgi:hypothetical protein